MIDILEALKIVLAQVLEEDTSQRQKLGKIGRLLSIFPQLSEVEIELSTGERGLLADVIYQQRQYELCVKTLKAHPNLSFDKAIFKKDARSALMATIQEKDKRHGYGNTRREKLKAILELFPELIGEPVEYQGRQILPANLAVELRDFYLFSRYDAPFAVEGVEGTVNYKTLIKTMTNPTRAEGSGRDVDKKEDYRTLPAEVFEVPLPSPYGPSELLANIILRSPEWYNKATLMRDLNPPLRIGEEISRDPERNIDFMLFVKACTTGLDRVYQYDTPVEERPFEGGGIKGILERRPDFVNIPIPISAKTYMSPVAAAILKDALYLAVYIAGRGGVITKEDRDKKFVHESSEKNYDLVTKARLLFHRNLAGEAWHNAVLLANSVPDLCRLPLLREESYRYVEETTLLPASLLLERKKFAAALKLVEKGGQVQVWYEDYDERGYAVRDNYNWSEPLDRAKSAAYLSLLAEIEKSDPSLDKITEILEKNPELANSKIPVIKDQSSSWPMSRRNMLVLDWALSIPQIPEEAAIAIAESGGKMNLSGSGEVEVTSEFVSLCCEISRAIRREDREASRTLLGKHPDLLKANIYISRWGISGIMQLANDTSAEIYSDLLAIRSKNKPKKPEIEKEESEEDKKARWRKEKEAKRHTFYRLIGSMGFDRKEELDALIEVMEKNYRGGKTSARYKVKPFKGDNISEEYTALLQVLAKTIGIAKAIEPNIKLTEGREGRVLPVLAAGVGKMTGSWQKIDKALIPHKLRHCSDVGDLVREVTRYLVLPFAAMSMGNNWIQDMEVEVDKAENTLMPYVATTIFEGRTLDVVFKLSKMWHEARNAIIEAMRDSFPEGEWPPLLLEPVKISSGEAAGLRIVDLKNTKDLQEEGERLNHCAGSYFSACQSARSQIWSIRNENGESLSTVEIEVVKGEETGPDYIKIPGKECSLHIKQHRAMGTDTHRGGKPPPKECHAAIAWLKSHIESYPKTRINSLLFSTRINSLLNQKPTKKIEQGSFANVIGWDPRLTEIEDFCTRSWGLMTLNHLRTGRHSHLIPREPRQKGPEGFFKDTDLALEGIKALSRHDHKMQSHKYDYLGKMEKETFKRPIGDSLAAAFEKLAEKGKGRDAPTTGKGRGR